MPVSTTIDPVIQGNATGQAFHRLFEPLVKLRLLIVAGLVQVGHPPFLDESPGTAAWLALHRRVEPLVTRRVLIGAGLVQVGRPPFLDESPGTAAFVAMFRVPDAKRNAA